MHLREQRVVILGDLHHLVFTAGEPLALVSLAALDLDQAGEFFAVR